MQDRTVVYFTDRGQWRAWLAEHFETETEVWFVFPTIRSGEKGVLKTAFVYPQDIMDAIKDDDAAWANFQTFPDSYKRIRIAYIDSARKRPEEFRKRLNNFIEKTRRNKRIVGYGGVEKYHN